MKSDESIEAERADLEPVIGPTRAGWYVEACKVEHGDAALLWACRYREMAPALYYAEQRAAVLRAACVEAAADFALTARALRDCNPAGADQYDAMAAKMTTAIAKATAS